MLDGDDSTALAPLLGDDGESLENRGWGIGSRLLGEAS